MKNVLDMNDSLINGHDDSLFELLTITSGGQCPRSFQISKKDAKLSNLISSILEGDKDSKIPITQVLPQVLYHVVAYLMHHKGVEPEPMLQPIRSIDVAKLVCDEWDATWIDSIDENIILGILLAANYMDIKSLVSLCCVKIATSIYQLSQSEIERLINGNRSDESGDKKEEDNEGVLTVLCKMITQDWVSVNAVITEEKCKILIAEYVRQYKYGQLLPAKMIGVITQFCWDSEYLTIQSGGKDPSVYVVKKVHWALSTSINSSDILEVTKVRLDILKHVVIYMAHHKGVEPDPLPSPVRSNHMAQIVSDQWDATFIDAFDKKTIFEIMLAANYLGIDSLIHLACAKNATLVRQLDQREIIRIIEKERKYRREHAAISPPSNPADTEDQNGN